MKKVMWLVVWVASMSVAMLAADLGVQGELAYNSGDYELSQKEYLRLLGQKKDVTAAMYNLGNIELQQGHIGQAVCWYRKVLRAVPRDSDTLHNIALARAKAVDDVERVTVHKYMWLFRWLRWMSYTELMAWFLVVVTLANVSWMLWYLGGREEGLRVAFIAGLCLSIVLAASVGIKWRAEIQYPEAVLINEKVAVRSGPLPSLPTLFFVHEGLEFYISRESKNWSEITLKNGFKGWIPRENYCAI